MRALLLPLLLLPVTASAFELDYYTYNGFEETVAAFQRLALIISDDGFLVFVMVFAAIGATFGALKAGYDGFVGSQINPIGFLIPIVVGIAVFKGAVLSTGTVHVYDPVRNAYEPVAGVPDLIVVLAGTLSKIERGIVEITDTASANPYADAAGGINYALVKAAMDSDLNDRYLEKSIVEYYNYCGMRALGQSTTGGWGQKLMHGSDDLLDDFSNWTNGVLSVVYYPPDNDQGEVLSCTDAWAALNARLTDPSTFDAYIDSVCRTVGMNPLDAAQRGRCQDLLAQTSALYDVATPGVLPYLRSILLAKGVSDATNSADFSRGQRALVDRQVMAEAFGTAEAMNSWVPRLRAYMMATVLGLIPMTLLFLVTPLFKSAVGLMLGLFAWLALWGTCDAIAVQMSLDSAADAFDQIRTQHYGVEGLLQSPEAAVQALGVFGKARLVALTLATALSAALFKFGGYAFAQLGQQWQGHLEQAGEAAAHNTLQPEVQGAFQRALIGAAGPQAALATAGFQNAAIGSASQDVGTASFGGQYVDASVTGASMSSIQTETAARTTGQSIGQNRAAERFAGGEDSIMGAIRQTSEADASRSLGRSDVERQLDSQQFGSPQKAGEFDAAGAVSHRIGLREQLEARTGSNAITSSGIEEVTKVTNASSIAANQLFDPQGALDLSLVQQTESAARAAELGLEGATQSGTGAAIDALASGSGAIHARSALGSSALADANLAGRIAGVAGAENQRAGAIAFGGDGRSIIGRLKFERDASAQRTVFISQGDKEEFLRAQTMLNEDQISRLVEQPGGLTATGMFDPQHPELGVQAGDFSVQTSARAGQSYSYVQGGDDRTGNHRIYQNGQLTLADPLALTTKDAVSIYRDMLFDDGHELGAFSDQEETALANAWANVVHQRGLSGVATDQETTSGNASIDGRFGKGYAPPAGIGGSRGLTSVGVPAGASVGVGGNIGVAHVETGAVSNNFIVGAFREELGTALQEGRQRALRMFGESKDWNADQKVRAEEVIAQSVDHHMRQSEWAFVTQLQEETRAPTTWQETDMRAPELEETLTDRIGHYVDRLMKK